MAFSHLSLSEAAFSRLTPRAKPAYRAAFAHPNASLWLDKAGLTTPLRQAHFLAQVLHETGGLTILHENLRYSAKRLIEVFGTGRSSARVSASEAADLAKAGEAAIGERIYGHQSALGRKLGNTAPGDGFAFRGHGLVQITGRDCFRRMSSIVGVDLVANPELAVSEEWAVPVACAYWMSRNANLLADADSVSGVTRLINGGSNGLVDRRRWLVSVKAAQRASLSPAAAGRLFSR